jgi:muramoyltetrapeptide carboxypeptidase
VKLAMPAPLAPGDLAAVVAPSSPCSRVDELWRGLAWLRTRYRIRMSAGALCREGYLAGNDARRCSEMSRAMLDDDVRAIVASRGGYGAMRIVADLPWCEFARRPKWIVGFSDITALHAAAWGAGIASIHGPNVAGLGRAATPRLRAAWIDAVERPATAPHEWRGLRVMHGGHARGPLVGGNLTVIHALAAAGRLLVPPGSVLVLEDVAEAPYRVDRMLTSLLLAGYLANTSAIVFGGFDRCDGSEGPSVDEVLEERTRTLGVPVLAGAPFGHGTLNDSFVLGQNAVVQDDEVCFGATAL